MDEAQSGTGAVLGGKAVEYVVSVPRSVFAPGVDEVVLRYPTSPKDVALMPAEELAFGKMLVEPAVEAVKERHPTFERFVVSSCQRMLDEPADEAAAQWAAREFDDAGNLSFEYGGAVVVFTYPTPARVRELIAQTATVDSWRQNKAFLAATMLTPPSGLYTDVLLYQFCVAISNEVISDGIKQAGEAWAAKRTR